MNFNAMNFLLATRVAGKQTPKKQRNRAAMLAALSGDLVSAIATGRRARAEAQRDRAYTRLRQLNIDPAELEQIPAPTVNGPRATTADIDPDEVRVIRQKFFAYKLASGDQREKAERELLEELGVALDLEAPNPVPAGAEPNQRPDRSRRSS